MAKKASGKVKKPVTKPKLQNEAGKAGSRADRLQQELDRRNAELAILNSVGEAMAKSPDVKGVTRIVGDKVRDIFNAELTNEPDPHALCLLSRLSGI
jgi:hypothetical protein